jgi:uncharacterized protein YsxB (DUF464 family)
MITATAVVDTDLCLVQLDVNGHAEYSKTGTDIVLEVPYGRREWMMGITEYLLNGLSDLEKEFPAQVKLEITNNEE